jgi:hypothetical protein
MRPGRKARAFLFVEMGSASGGESGERGRGAGIASEGKSRARGKNACGNFASD